MILLILRLVTSLFGVLAGVGGLLLWMVLVLVFWLGTTTSGLRMVLQTLDSLNLMQVERAEGALLGRMSLQGVRVNAGEAQVAVQCAELDWRPLALFEGRAEVNTLWLAGVRVELAPMSNKDDTPSKPFSGLNLPLEVFVDDLRVDEVSLRTVNEQQPAGVTQMLLQSLNTRFSIEKTGLHVQHIQLDDVAGQAGSHVQVSGDWGLQAQDEMRFALDWSMPLRMPQAQGEDHWLPLAGSGIVSGTLQALDLQHQLTQPLAAELDAKVQPMTESLPWSVTLQVKPVQLAEHPALLRLAPAELAPHLGVLSAEVKAAGTQGMAHVEHIELRQDKTQLKLGGDVAWAEGLRWDVQAEASDLHPEIFAKDWPGTLAFLAQSQGQMQDGKPLGVFKLERMHGTLRGYPLEASMNAEIKAWAENALPELVLDALKLQSGGSTLEAKGRMGEQLDLSAKLNSANLAELVPQAGGRAQANMAIQGTQAEPNIKADLQGQALSWQDMAIAVLDVQGEFTLPVVQDKKISLPPDAPLKLKLDMQKLSQGGKPLMDIAKLELTGSARAHDLQIDLAQAEGKSAQGKQASPTASITSKNEKTGLRMNMQARGTWDGLLERLRIQNMQVEESSAGSWASTQPVELVAGIDQVTLPAWCGALTTPPGKAKACIQGQWRAGKEGAQARLELEDFDLAGLNTMLEDKPIQLRGELGGFVAVNAPQGAPLRVQAVILGQEVVARVQTGLPKQLLSGVPEWREIPLNATQLTADLGGGVGQLALDVGINDANRLEAKLNFPGLALDGGLSPVQAMRGYVDLRFEDNSLLAGFLPMLKEPQGRLAGRLIIAGTLESPKISGGVQVVDGGVLLPDLGVRVREGQMLLRANSTNELTLEGSALLGQGRAKLSGRIDLANLPRWQAKLRVEGENLTVMRLPNASVQASPDLTLNLAPGMQNIRGKIVVPQALFDVGGFGAGAVRRSSDVRVLGEAPPEPAGAIDADVLLVLGDEVRIEGMGFKGRVQGQIRVLDRPGQAAPLAQGELNLVDASYRAYGQDLVIQQGRIMFANSPLSNPGFDIRAVRRQTQDNVVVGVHISGQATTPKIALFSQPYLPQSEMLSYLVTGRSSKTSGGASTQTMLQIAQAAGMMAASDLAESSVARDLGLDELGFETALGTNDISLAIGKYLTPRIYLRYLQGLGNGVQDIVMTFDWTRAIQIRAQVGSKASGMDVFYRFER